MKRYILFSLTLLLGAGLKACESTASQVEKNKRQSWKKEENKVLPASSSKPQEQSFWATWRENTKKQIEEASSIQYKNQKGTFISFSKQEKHNYIENMLACMPGEGKEKGDAVVKMNRQVKMMMRDKDDIRKANNLLEEDKKREEWQQQHPYRSAFGNACKIASPLVTFGAGSVVTYFAIKHGYIPNPTDK